MGLEITSGVYSKGNQTKFIYNGYFYKKDMFGYESISEVLVSEFFSYIKDISFLDYSLEEVNISGRKIHCCKSKIYTSEGKFLVSLYRLLQVFDGIDYLRRTDGKDSVDYIVDFIKRPTGLDAYDYLAKMFILDTIILNEDRHLNNICFVYKDGKYSLAPLFDNGLSLLSDLDAYPMSRNTLSLMRKVKSKPFSTSFVKQVGYFSFIPIRVDYTGFRSKLEEVEENLTRYIPFKQKEYYRAKDVLLRRLRETEGKLWVRK